MKASSFRYLINQGFKGIWKNRMMTFASFCILLVSLLMVGTSVLVSINLTRIIGGIEDKSEVNIVKGLYLSGCFAHLLDILDRYLVSIRQWVIVSILEEILFLISHALEHIFPRFVL